MNIPQKSDIPTTSEAALHEEHSENQDIPEIARFQRENEALKNQLTKLSDATRRVIEVQALDSLLQNVVESAQDLTDAKYAVLLTYDEAGSVDNAVTSGISPEQINRIEYSPEGIGLLGYLNEVNGPVRIADISTHPRAIGFPNNHPPMKTFLGMKISSQGEHVGNLFLTEKEGNGEFTIEDEEILVMFASLAAQAISNARRYQEMFLAKADLETLINISPVGVAVFDATTARMVSSNREARRISGDLNWPDLKRDSLLEMLSFRRADGRSISLAELPTSRVLQSGEIVRGEEIIIEFPDGRSVTTLVNAAPIFSESGEIASVVVTVQDMAPTEDLERLRAEFLGMVSEELRAPLAAIKGSTNALQETLKSMSGSETLHLLRIIDQQGDLMRSQINSLIDLSQIEAGTISVSTETASVSDLVNRASLEFQRTHASISVGTHIPLDLPWVTADTERINQVLKNLLSEISNLSGRRAGIRVSASQIDIYVAISVSSETASPASDETWPLSELYPQQPGEDTDRGSNRRELTIAFCRGIVEAHGGRMMVVRGKPGQGMMFTFTLPTADEQVDAGPPGSEPSGPLAGLSATEDATILVAVPDSRTMGTIRRILSNSDYSVVATYDPNEIESLIAAQRPQIVLLDPSVAMAEGMLLTRHLSQDFGMSVIVLSDKGDDEYVARAFHMGADDYIVKPFSPTELIVRIKSSLRKNASSWSRQSAHGYSLGNVTIDYDARTLTVSGSTVQLTATEYKLLCELSGGAGRVLTQDELLHRVWGPEYSGEPQLLRSYVKSLRQKLGDNARSPTFIFTEHGIGYRMAKP